MEVSKPHLVFPPVAGGSHPPTPNYVPWFSSLTVVVLWPVLDSAAPPPRPPPPASWLSWSSVSWIVASMARTLLLPDDFCLEDNKEDDKEDEGARGDTWDSPPPPLARFFSSDSCSLAQGSSIEPVRVLLRAEMACAGMFCAGKRGMAWKEEDEEEAGPVPEVDLQASGTMLCMYLMCW